MRYLKGSKSCCVCDRLRHKLKRQNKSLSPINYNWQRIRCNYCDKMFERLICKSDSPPLFCSRSCFYKSRRKGKLIRCKCGKSFYRTNEYIKNHKDIFCSHACYTKYSKTKHTPRPCKQCGIVFSPNNGHGSQIYCSTVCQQLGSIGHDHSPKRENCHLWKGGIWTNNPKYKRKYYQMTQWKEVINQTQDLPEKKRNEVLQQVETAVNLKMQFLDLRKQYQEVKNGYN